MLWLWHDRQGAFSLIKGDDIEYKKWVELQRFVEINKPKNQSSDKNVRAPLPVRSEDATAELFINLQWNE